ncbi:MAG: Ig-like domain-containing protein [Pseudonocardiaceae bacterium]
MATEPATPRERHGGRPAGQRCPGDRVDHSQHPVYEYYRLVISPFFLADRDSPVTLTASVTPSVAAGSVQFKDGATDLGIPVTVSNGTASATTSTLSGGSHLLTAVFGPDPKAADPAAFGASRSPPMSFVVIAGP